MPNDRRHDHDHDDLGAFWSELLSASGEPAARENNLNPELAETLRLLYALTRTPPPANARERLDQSVLPHLYSSPNGKETRIMDLSHALPRPIGGIGGIGINGRTSVIAPGHARSKRERQRPPWTIVQLATLMLLVVALCFGYLVYRDNRPAVVPSAQTTPTIDATPAPSDVHGWPMWGGNAAHTRHASGPAPVGQPVELWTFPEDQAQNIGTIFDWGVAADGVLYIPGSAGYVALDSRTGRELWRSTQVGGGGVIDGDGIVLRSATTNGVGYDLVRINRTDGSVVWRAEQGQIAEQAIPMIADGVGYVLSGDSLLAFNPSTGEQRWRVTLDAPLGPSPVIANGLVVVGDQSGKVYGVSIAGGDIVWTYQTDARTIRGLAIANGQAYFSTADGQTIALYALDVVTGDVTWRFESPTDKPLYGAAVGEQALYVTSVDGSLYALDVITGELRWTFPTNAVDANSAVLVEDLVLMAGVDGMLYAVDAITGVERWRYALDSGSDFVPVVVDGVIYVGTRTGSIYAIAGKGEEEPAATPDRTSSTQPTATVSPASAQTGIESTYLWSADAGVALLSFPPDRTIWATDVVAGTISILDRDGGVISTWGTPGEAPGQFNFKEDDAAGWWVDYAFASDGSFWITECGNERIEHFDAARTLIGSIGTKGTRDGQFLCPSGIVVGTDGDLYVSDHTRKDVQRFHPDGTFVSRFTGLGGPGTLNLDGEGNIIVSDSNGGQVVILSPDLTALGELGERGDSTVPLSGPVDSVVDDAGNYFVADQYIGEVLVYSPDRAFIGTIDTGTTPDGPVTGVYSIGYGGNGSLYVTVGLPDGTVRMQKYKVVVPTSTAAGSASPIARRQ